MRDGRTYYVYVIELRSKDRNRPEVYVGSSAFSPKRRFLKHLREPRGSRHVRSRGVRLLPSLYEEHNPLSSRLEAKRTEQRIRRALEAKGYKVYGACRPDESLSCSKEL